MRPNEPGSIQWVGVGPDGVVLAGYTTPTASRMVENWYESDSRSRTWL